MKNKIKPAIFIITTACIFVFILSGCVAKKYFTEFKASYIYDKENQIFKKFPSELEWEPEELIFYENKKATNIEYDVLSVALPKVNYNTGEISDFNIAVAYTVYNGRLALTDIPVQYALYDYYILNDKTDSLIITIDDDNAFLVNLNDASVKKLFSDSQIEYCKARAEESGKKLVYAKTVSVSPDGKYVLYLTNRNYIETEFPNSLDIYYHNLQTGTEVKIMNFDKKEFLCWENLDINPNASGNFLFREVNITATTGKKNCPDIRRYSIKDSKEDIFMTLGDPDKYYEMIGDQYIYTFEPQQTDETLKINKKYNITVYDIYLSEIIAVADAGIYSTVWHLDLSENKEYLAFFGTYINPAFMAISEIVTVNLQTNNMIAFYEQNEGIYFIDSFSWCPDNILAINFQNTSELYKDLCRLHKINH